MIGGCTVWLEKLWVLIGVSCVFPVMRRNPFVVDGCCRKGSRNALQELYNPTEVNHLTQHKLFFSVLVPIATAAGHAQDLLSG